MIRPARPDDSSSLIAVCESTGLFPPEELATIQALFDDYHATNAAQGHKMLASMEDGTPSGVAYLIPKEMTDRTWELLMIMVEAKSQGQGVGSGLLRAAEEAVKAADGRLLLIETGSTADFEKTRQFYAKGGYDEVASVPDYYAQGVGKVTFIKLL